MNYDFIEKRTQYRTAIIQRYGVSAAIFDNVTRALAALAQPVSLRRGQYLQTIGKMTPSLYWLCSGVARVGYITEAGEEVTLGFSTDGQAVGLHEDWLRARAGEPAVHFVVAETAIHGYRLDWSKVQLLSAENRALREYYVKVSESSIVRQGQRIYVSRSASARGRLQAFRAEYPGLEARISQKVIASFLGITPQYLSQLLRENESAK